MSHKATRSNLSQNPRIDFSELYKIGRLLVSLAALKLRKVRLRHGVTGQSTIVYSKETTLERAAF